MTQYRADTGMRRRVMGSSDRVISIMSIDSGEVVGSGRVPDRWRVCAFRESRVAVDAQKLYRCLAVHHVDVTAPGEPQGNRI